MEPLERSGELELIKTTPGSYLGSCRYKLPEDLDDPVYPCLLYTSQHHFKIKRKFFLILYQASTDKAVSCFCAFMLRQSIGYIVIKFFHTV